MTGQHQQGHGYRSLARQKEAPRRPHSPGATAGCPKPQRSCGQGRYPGWLLGKCQASPHRFASGTQHPMNKDSPCPSSHRISALSPEACAVHPPSGPDTPRSRGGLAPGPGSLDLTPLVLCGGLQDTPSATGPRGPWTQLRLSSARASLCSVRCPTAGSSRGLWEDPAPRVSLHRPTRGAGDEAPGGPRVHCHCSWAQRAQTLLCPFWTSSVLPKASDLWPSPARGLRCGICCSIHGWLGTLSGRRGPSGPESVGPATWTGCTAQRAVGHPQISIQPEALSTPSPCAQGSGSRGHAGRVIWGDWWLAWGVQKPHGWRGPHPHLWDRQPPGGDRRPVKARTPRHGTARAPGQRWLSPPASAHSQKPAAEPQPRTVWEAALGAMSATWSPGSPLTTPGPQQGLAGWPPGYRGTGQSLGSEASCSSRAHGSVAL